MNAFVTKLVILGLVAGGFFLTGDLRWMVDRGRRIVEQPTIPTGSAVPSPGFAATPVPVAPVPAAPPQAPPPPQPPAAPIESRQPVVERGAEPASPAEPSRIAMPALDDDAIDLAAQPPGRRILLLVEGHVVALDVVDGPAGEVLEHRHVVHVDRTVSIASTAVPRRMRAVGSAAAGRFGGLASRPRPGRIARGEWLELLPSGQPGSATPEIIGPIRGIGIE